MPRTNRTEARRQNVFRALGDGVRRRILDRLAADGETPALALGDEFDVSQPAVSKHLKVLRDAGLVRVRRVGRSQIYDLARDGLQPAQDWFEQLQRFWNARLDALGRHLDSAPRA